MEPVNTGSGGNVYGGYAAGGRFPYGALVARSAAGECNATPTGTTDLGYLGVALDKEVDSETSPGFYVDGDMVAIKTSGPAKVWLKGGETIVGGDFVLMAAAIGASTELIGAVSVEATPATRTAASVGRVIGNDTSGDVGSADYDQTLEANAASAQKVITLTAAKIALLDLVKGDYVIIDDNSTGEINKVTAVGTTTVTMQHELANAYTTAAAATIYKLVQVEVELI